MPSLHVGRYACETLLLAVGFSLHGIWAADLQPLENFSLTRPLDSPTLQSRWRLGGKAEIRPEGVVLNPKQVGTAGTLWSKHFVPTDTFEVNAVVRVETHHPGHSSLQEGFALWYVHDDGVQHWHKAEAKQFRTKYFNLFGYQETYDGVGVFFYFDAGSPMANAFTNTGKEKRVSRMDVLTADGGLGLYDVLLGRKAKKEPELDIKLRVEPHRAVLEVAGCGQMQIDSTFRAGGHIALTAMPQGRGGRNASPSKVEITHLNVLSYQEVGHRADEL